LKTISLWLNERGKQERPLPFLFITVANRHFYDR
jgi:hypothetical protein